MLNTSVGLQQRLRLWSSWIVNNTDFTIPLSVFSWFQCYSMNNIHRNASGIIRLNENCVLTVQVPLQLVSFMNIVYHKSIDDERYRTGNCMNCTYSPKSVSSLQWKRQSSLYSMFQSRPTPILKTEERTIMASTTPKPTSTTVVLVLHHPPHLRHRTSHKPDPTAPKKETPTRTSTQAHSEVSNCAILRFPGLIFPGFLQILSRL